jgi:hypothetical protein
MLHLFIYYPGLIVFESATSQSIYLILLITMYLLVLLFSRDWKKIHNLKDIAVNLLIIVILSVVIYEEYFE